MSARPIIPGQLYHVQGQGIDVKVIASNSFEALLAVLPSVLPCAD